MESGFKHLRPTKPNTSYINSKLFNPLSNPTIGFYQWLIVSKLWAFKIGTKTISAFFTKRVKCTKSYFPHSRLKTNVPVSLIHQFTFRKTISSYYNIFIQNSAYRPNYHWDDFHFGQIIKHNTWGFNYHFTNSSWSISRQQFKRTCTNTKISNGTSFSTF